VPGPGEIDHPAAQADDVQVVVLNPLVRRKVVVDQRRAHPGYLVGGDGGAHPAGAQGDAALDLPGGDRPGQGDHEVGIVVFGIEMRRAEVQHLVPLAGKGLAQPLLEGEAAVVRRDAKERHHLSPPRPSSSRARARTASTVKPYSLSTTSPGAEAP